MRNRSNKSSAQKVEIVAQDELEVFATAKKRAETEGLMTTNNVKKRHEEVIRLQPFSAAHQNRYCKASGYGRYHRIVGPKAENIK